MAVTFKDGVILGTSVDNSLSLRMGLEDREKTLADTEAFPHTRRRRLPHDHRGVHREPSNGQADKGARHHLVLPVGIGGRYAGRGRHCAVPPGALGHDERQAAHDADGGGALPGHLLFQQGPAIVRDRPPLQLFSFGFVFEPARGLRMAEAAC